MSRRATRRFQSRSASETEALGADLAARLKQGDVVLVSGELGAGKTTFVRGACRALGVSATVNSPTFTIGQRYPGPVPVAHLDLYRVEDLGREDPDLLADYLGPDAVAFIELPPEPQALRAAVERTVSEIAAVAASVSLTHAGGDERTVEIE